MYPETTLSTYVQIGHVRMSNVKYAYTNIASMRDATHTIRNGERTAHTTAHTTFTTVASSQSTHIPLILTLYAHSPRPYSLPETVAILLCFYLLLFTNPATMMVATVYRDRQSH
eukprot:4158555-Pleurochrysis_carterae.AAC.1